MPDNWWFSGNTAVSQGILLFLRNTAVSGNNGGLGNNYRRMSKLGILAVLTITCSVTHFRKKWRYSIYRNAVFRKQQKAGKLENPEESDSFDNFNSF